MLPQLVLPLLQDLLKPKMFPPPSHAEQQEFFRQIAQEEEKSPIVLSVIEPYSNHFVLSRDHLPKLLQGLFKPAYLGTDLAELLKLAESHLHMRLLLKW